MSWKIDRDPFLAPLADRFGEEAVWASGFFEDSDAADAPLDDVDWLCTPFANVVAGLANADPGRTPVVLLATGAFWPPHEGHLAMIERARTALDATGLAVVGGYLSPGHDEYLTLKWGKVAPPAAARIAMLDALVSTHDWLDVDPWEALHRRVAVNFTDVVARLEAYLRQHVDRRIEVCLVCGGDNARFALAFAERGRCAVVSRPGSEAEVARWMADDRVATDGRVVWADGGHPAASSSLDPSAWQEAPTPQLRLRLEDASAVRSIAVDPDRLTTFQQSLARRLANLRDVEVVHVDEQSFVADHPVISLDPMTPGDVDLGVSRVFDVGGRRLLGHAERPGCAPLDEQVAAIDPGDHVLIDDDSVTGGTLAFVAHALPPTVRVVQTVTLMEPADGEIADSRDFLVGTDAGGLVVRLADGTTARAPYLLPYVDPHKRCGVAAADVVAFSIDIWRRNAQAYAGTGRVVDDLPDASRRLFRAVGRAGTEPLVELCAWHADTLGGFVGIDR